MNLRQPFIIITTLILIVTNARAATWTPDNLPVPYLQDNRQYVSNPDGVLNAQTVDSINTLLNELEHNKGVQTLVVAVTNIEGDKPYDFCMRLGRKYGIGSKQSTGLIVLLASDDRGYQILTGNGLEGTLPDAICRRIQNRITIPLLREGKWDEAMLRTVEALKSCIDGDTAIVSDRDDNSDDDDAAAAAVAAFFCMGLAGLSIAYVAFRRKKCPQCRKARMRTVSRKRVKMLGSNRYRWRVERQCPKCKYIQVDFEDDTDDFRNGTGTLPPIIGGGGGRSGGSFPTGGTFGGGSFGGGGSGGHF